MKCTFSVMCCSFRFLQNIQYTQKKVHVYVCHTYTKKDLNDPDNHDGMITHLEPDILESEVKWALGSITMNKDSVGD